MYAALECFLFWSHLRVDVEEIISQDELSTPSRLRSDFSFSSFVSSTNVGEAWWVFELQTDLMLEQKGTSFTAKSRETSGAWR